MPIIFVLSCLAYLYQFDIDKEELNNIEVDEEELNNFEEIEYNNEDNSIKILPKKEKRILDYDYVDEELDYFPDNTDYYAKLEEQNKKEKEMMERIQKNLLAYHANKYDVKDLPDNSIPQSAFSTTSSNFTDKVNQIKSGDVIFSPSPTESTINQNFSVSSPIISTTPTNTPITTLPKVIITHPVAENEPIPPLPNWKEIPFDHPDYHIRNKREIRLRYSEMVNNPNLNRPSGRNQEWIETEALGIEELFSGDYSKLTEGKSYDLDKETKN